MWNWFQKSQKELEVKESQVAHLIAAKNVGKPVWTPRQFDQLAEEGYQKNVIVYRCVSLIAGGIASVPWEIHENGETLCAHPLEKLIRAPNPNQALARFMEALSGYLMLSGNAYIEMVQVEGEPLELHLLRPDRVRVIPGISGVPEAYEYRVGSFSRKIPVNPLNGASTILHLKTFHPLNDWYGMSPLEAAAHAIDQHNAVGGHNLAVLQNGGRPSGALILPSGTLTSSQRQALKEDFRDFYQGGPNAGNIFVLEGEWDWKELSISPKDLDFIEGKYLSAREIAQAFGVPAMLVGVPGEATFSNYREARYHLWEDTILPLLESIKTELNRWLVPCFASQGKLELTYDTDSISALTPRREGHWNKIAQANFLTINEKRQAVGYAPIEGGDRV
ncbi:Phage portal protein [Candidatus Bealeia paramacronuclearis]|uniref:Phage portal protein n=1 Tax=Candidatus Bealeia paramacronuclearis TaxID=1921001 RepID=A0ABZ2C6B4_9PROT|nr:Phage portal protein [Candidatus Bealeia paramacronuclearis]